MFMQNKMLTQIQFKRSRLAVAMMLVVCGATISSNVLALESMNDQAMSDITGQDGLVVNVQADKVSFGNLYWQDQIDNSGTTRQLQLTGATITPNGTSSFSTIAQINTGSDGSAPALNLTLTTSPFLLAAPRLEICTSTSSCANPSLGGFAFKTSTPTVFSLATTNGFLNSAGTANVTLSLSNASAFFTLGSSQLVAANMTAHINAAGRIWIDATDGFRFQGDVTLLNSTPSNYESGLQATLMLQSGNTTTVSPIAGGLLRVGVSGKLQNTSLYLRGTSGTAANEDSVGSLVGAQGIAMRLKGDIQSGALNADGSTQGGASGKTGPGLQLELSGAGSNGYGIQMTNFVPFNDVKAGTVSTIDSGNIYLNLINSNILTMPTSTVFTGGTAAVSAAKGGKNTVNYFGMTSSDYTNQMIQNPAPATPTDSVYLAVRGLNVQGVPLQTFFYQTPTYNSSGVGVSGGRVTTGANYSAGVVSPVAQTASNFALMPVLYNVNANLAISGSSATELGYALSLTTDGTNGATSNTGLKATSLFLADTGNYQYIGLRNMSLFVQANGKISFGDSGAGIYGSKNGGLTCSTVTCTSNSINISLSNFQLAVSAGFAAGYLPGAEPSGFKTYADPANTDTLFNINARFKGKANSTTNGLSLYTNTNGALGYSADLTLDGVPVGPADTGLTAGTSFVRLSQPGAGGTLGIDNLTGRILLAAPQTDSAGGNVPGSGLIVKNDANGGYATFTTTLIVNPEKVRGGELLGTLDFYSDATSAGAMPLGKIVMTGGQMISNVTLRPVTF